jgi:hypothetical protein
VDDQKQKKRQIEYLIKWKDWPEDYNTWLKVYLYLKNTKELVKEYRESHGLNEPLRKAYQTKEEADRTSRKRRRP